MDWIDWVVGICFITIGYAIRGAVDDFRYPKPKYRWQCPHCPVRIGASDREVLRFESEKHHDQQHPFEEHRQ